VIDGIEEVWGAGDKLKVVGGRKERRGERDGGINSGDANVLE
jgi:hypothetical protein